MKPDGTVEQEPEALGLASTAPLSAPVPSGWLLDHSYTACTPQGSTASASHNHPFTPASPAWLSGSRDASGRHTHISASWSTAGQWPFPPRLEAAWHVGQGSVWLGGPLAHPFQLPHTSSCVAGSLQPLGFTSLLYVRAAVCRKRWCLAGFADPPSNLLVQQLERGDQHQWSTCTV